MVLKEDDIAAFRVNWDDKAANIKAIADMLDLGLDSFVFLDDNPAERKRVRDALPVGRGARTARGSERMDLGVSGRRIFRAGELSPGKTSLRAGFYKANARRAAQLERIGNHDDYLRSLDMTLVDRAVRCRRAASASPS